MIKMRLLKVSLILTILLITIPFILITAGCSTGESSSNTIDFQIGIRGIITDISLTEDGAAIMVEGQVEEDTVYDRASVRINDDTMIQKDDMSRLFEISDLRLGDRVEVYFSGPVAESYPVQGTAAIVRIITK
jgi:beta-N-acetylhexosaminidase